MSEVKYAIGSLNGAIEHYEKAQERGEWYGNVHGHVRLYNGLKTLCDAAEEGQ